MEGRREAHNYVTNSASQKDPHVPLLCRAIGQSVLYLAIYYHQHLDTWPFIISSFYDPRLPSKSHWSRIHRQRWPLPKCTADLLAEF